MSKWAVSSCLQLEEGEAEQQAVSLYLTGGLELFKIGLEIFVGGRTQLFAAALCKSSIISAYVVVYL